MKQLNSITLSILINIIVCVQLQAMEVTKSLLKNGAIAGAMAAAALTSNVLAHEAGHSIVAKILCGASSVLHYEPLKNPFISSVGFEGDKIPAEGLNAFLIDIAGPVAGAAFCYAMLKVCNVLNEHSKGLTWLKALKKGLRRSPINRDTTVGQYFFVGAMCNNLLNLLPVTANVPSEKYNMETFSDGYRAMRALNLPTKSIATIDCRDFKSMLISQINALPITLPCYLVYDFIFSEDSLYSQIRKQMSSDTSE